MAALRVVHGPDGPAVEISSVSTIEAVLEVMATNGFRYTPEYRRLAAALVECRRAGRGPLVEVAPLDEKGCDTTGWLSVRTVAASSGCSWQRIRKIAADLGGVKVDGEWRFPPEAIDRYAAMRRAT